MFITMKAQCKQYIKRISFQSKKIIILLVKMIHFPNKLRSHLVVIVQKAPFTLNLTFFFFFFLVGGYYEEYHSSLFTIYKTKKIQIITRTSKQLHAYY